MIKGIDLSIMFGPGVPVAAPASVVDALEEVSIQENAGETQSESYQEYRGHPPARRPAAQQRDRFADRPDLEEAQGAQHEESRGRAGRPPDLLRDEKGRTRGFEARRQRR